MIKQGSDKFNAIYKKAISSTLNYTRLIHKNNVQDYFVPIYEAVDEPGQNRIAVSACHAVGKTYNFARIIDALVHRYRYVKIISTAPTNRQVKDLLWNEIATAYDGKHKIFQKGRLKTTELFIDSETYAKGFSPQKSAQTGIGQTDSNFQGYHAKFLTVVVFDEATGVEESIWKQAEGLLTSGHKTLFLTIGNPTTRNCNFFKCFHGKVSRQWKKFNISCFDTPNLKSNNIHSVEDVERESERIRKLPDNEALEVLNGYKVVAPYLISARWVIEKAMEWGTDHPLFMGKVLGQFPLEDSDALVTDSEIEASQKLESIDLQKETEGFLGLDVARFGVDKSVLTAMIKNQQVDVFGMVKNDTNEVCGKVINKIQELKKKYPNIKKWRLAVDGGFGHGVIDVLREKKKQTDDKRVNKILSNVEILEISFGASDWIMFHYGWIGDDERKKKEKDRKVQEERQNYCNFKSKMFDLLSLDIKNKRIKLLNDPIYIDQLPTIKKVMDSSGRLGIESKEDYKKRTGETSPDEADSLALCNFARYFAIKSLSMLDAIRNRRQ